MEFKSYKHVRRHTPCCVNSSKVHHKSLYWVSINIFKLLVLVTQMQFTYASDVVRVVGLFESVKTNQETAFLEAVDAVNKDENLLLNAQLTAQIKRVPQNDSFIAARKVCSVLKSGVGAIFGPQSSKTSAHIRSICDALEIPHLETKWNIRFTRNDYSVNLYPHPSTLAKAYTDVLNYLGWKRLCIIYENNNGLIRVQELIKDEDFHVSLKQLPLSSDYRPMLEEAKKDGVRNIVLDIEREKIVTVLKQAQEVGMMNDYYNYFITSLDLHTVDLEDFRHGGTNMIALQLVDPQNPMVQQVIKKLRNGSNNHNKIQTEVALMYDAVHLYAKALDDLNQSQHIDITPLECDADATWAHGTSLLNYIKVAEINGLSGLIKFDSEGFRSDVTLDVVDLSKDGLTTIGRWDRTSGVNYTRTHQDIEAGVKESLQNRNLIVSAVLAEPYVMLAQKEWVPEELTGNDRYEGFCVDLIDELSRHLGFNYTIVLSPDGQRGQPNPKTNQWNGMLGEILNLNADIAIGDITITHERAQAVDFTMPWMDTGISILYVKPQRGYVQPIYFCLYPLSAELWICLVAAYLGVSLLLFLLAKLSPYERVTQTIVDQFSCNNSMWFTWAGLLQQKTDQHPRAASTRILSGTWWFFTLMMIMSYTASLVTFFLAQPLPPPIESLDDLASQTKIKYGTVKGGATWNYFKTSENPTHQRMVDFMESQRPSVFVSSTEDGAQRVSRQGGRYAFLMEESSIKYMVERRCDLYQVGGLLDHKSFGFALPPGSPYRTLIDEVILYLRDRGIVNRLRKKWYYQMRGGGLCMTSIHHSKSFQAKEIGLHNFGGVFILLAAGLGLASVVAIFEFLWGKWKKPAAPQL